MRTAAGERFREAKSVADNLSEIAFDDWALSGPRATKYWFQQVARTGLAQ